MKCEVFLNILMPEYCGYSARSYVLHHFQNSLWYFEKVLHYHFNFIFIIFIINKKNVHLVVFCQNLTRVLIKYKDCSFHDRQATMQSFYNTVFKAIEMDHVICESCFIGTLLQSN